MGAARIIVTMGDPGGVGPEVTVRALADAGVRRGARFLVLGTGSALREAMRACSRRLTMRVLDGAPGNLAAKEPVVLLDYEAMDEAEYRVEHAHSRLGGQLSLRFVRDAIAMARGEHAIKVGVRAIVTAPISKTSWALAGEERYRGHTELFADAFGASSHAMMFDSPELRVILATTHIPLAGVVRELTRQRVEEVIRLGAGACRRLGVRKPRLAVCGLNPHAGEGGLLGEDEARVIAPAIGAARRAGIDAQGPFPPDTIFARAVRRAGLRRAEFDMVVAMYHDQGLIPLKLLAFDHAVNVTVGLPIVRTSPDHGTAFDIAGKGRADAGSMRAALRLAARWSVRG